MRPEVEPVWLLFRRRVISRLEYWCLILGFDMRDHSLTNRLYFIYFFLFWATWAMAVFTLCASSLVDFLAERRGGFTNFTGSTAGSFRVGGVDPDPVVAVQQTQPICVQ